MNETTQCFSGKWENLLLFSDAVFVVVKKKQTYKCTRKTLWE